tara:strand:- start:705 stop:950 length:246 start_codon:yes stop_codon:yes gene_type:complete
MALHICPNCKKESFSWLIDEEVSELTIWGCNECRYQAFEDESEQRICNKCGKRSELRLKDDEKEYWWCTTCKATELIKNYT